MAKRNAAMAGKGLYFVTGHPRPAVAKPDDRFVRLHPDGTPMLAIGTRDTLDACRARWDAAADSKAKGRAKTASAPADEPAPADPALPVPKPAPVPWQDEAPAVKGVSFPTQPHRTGKKG